MNIGHIEPRRLGKADCPLAAPMMLFEHLDLRYVAAFGPKTAGLQTIRSLLASKSPPADEREQEQGEGRLGAHGGNVLIRDCTVDADIPIAVDDAALILVASDIRGFGHVSWAEIGFDTLTYGDTFSWGIACTAGDTICFGGEDVQELSTWGVTLSNDYPAGDTSECAPCGAETRTTISLTCSQ
jgi:hypothetical protein